MSPARLSDLTRSDWIRLARYAAVGIGCAAGGAGLGWLWVVSR